MTAIEPRIGCQVETAGRNLSALFLLCCLAGCGGYPDDIDLGGLDEPDRTLYDRAVHDLDRGQLTRSRLLFQNLVNTYPDSEYLPLAKYGLAETFYHGGSRADMVQAQAEFKDFITFFPTSDMADDAQMLVAMAHVRQMEKSDRDPTQGQMAEVELQNMIASYPDSDLAVEARELLRAVQDVLAEHHRKVADFYATTGNYAGAVDRYLEVLDRYPDYTDLAESVYRLGETMRRGQNDGEAIVYYNRVIRNHPMTDAADEARERLEEMGQPVPTSNPAALARAESAEPPEGKGIFARVFGLWSRRPDVPTDTAAASIIPREEDGEGAGTGLGTFEVEGAVLGTEGPPER